MSSSEAIVCAPVDGEVFLIGNVGTSKQLSIQEESLGEGIPTKLTTSVVASTASYDSISLYNNAWCLHVYTQGREDALSSTFRNIRGGSLLALPNNGTEDGAVVRTSDKDSDFFDWCLEMDVHTPHWRIHNTTTGAYLQMASSADGDHRDGARIQCCKRQENDSQRWLLRRISCKSGTNFSAENLLGQIPAIAKTYAYVSRDTIFIALPSEIIEHVPTGESIGLDYFRNDVIACKAKHTMSRDYRENVSGNYTGETQICPLLGIAYVPEAEEEQREPGKKRFYLFTLATTGKLVFYSVDELGFEQEPIDNLPDNMVAFY